MMGHGTHRRENLPMAPPEYTDRILPGEAVYLAPNGRFHRAGCRYYVAPGPDAVFVEGTFTEAFLANSCKLCFPDGVPAAREAAMPVEIAPVAIAPVAEPVPVPVVASPEGPPEPSLPEAGAALAGLPPLPPEPVAQVPPEPAVQPPPPPDLPPVPAALADERLVPADDRGARKRRKKQKLGNRPPAVTKVQVLIFMLVVVAGVGVFVALATLLHWFG